MMVNIYWISTALLSIFLVWSSVSYLFSESAIEGIRALGFPDFFRIQLAILKAVAAILILVKGVPLYVRDWSYAGIGLFLLTAIVAHLAHRDQMAIQFLLVFLVFTLMVSRYTLGQLGE